MDRTLTKDTINKVGETVLLKGWVQTRRDHGKIVFLDIEDSTGIIQAVAQAPVVEGISQGYAVEIEGFVKDRPEKLVNPKLTTGKIELDIQKATIVGKAETYPFDMGKPQLDLELPTLLDFRSLTLRHPQVKAIFKVQEAVAEGFRLASRENGCTEVFPPTVSASSTEGGAEVFKFDYFGHEAFMVQSPQLYKQMMVGVFERVYLISHIYRAEPSITTRHLVESIQLDCELGFMDFEQLQTALESTFARTIAYAQETASQYLELLGVEKSKVYNKVPRLTMREAQQIIFERTGVDHRTEKDLMPEDEKEIAKWALEIHDSDLVTITHFPTKKRAFYTKPDPKDPEYSLSYDLLYKGLEISSGSQRIDDVDELIAVIKDRGMDPANFHMYLQAFKFGMPPHGGFSYGLERTTMKLLNLDNIRQASLYPRDMERVDLRLSEMKKAVKKKK